MNALQKSKCTQGCCFPLRKKTQKYNKRTIYQTALSIHLRMCYKRNDVTRAIDRARQKEVGGAILMDHSLIHCQFRMPYVQY